MRQFGGKWSETKLDCVESYARRYLQVMQKQSWFTLHYVDAFAGRGKQALKSSTAGNAEAQELEEFFGDESEREDAEAFLVGSALRALTASRQSDRRFDHFTLIDVDKPSCNELESVVEADFPDMKDRVNVLCEDANAALDNYVVSMDWGKTRALVFLDPYGLEVRWDTIRHLAGTGACDVWYLFPLGGVIRMMKNDGQIPGTWQARLDQLFGNHDWYDEFYSTIRRDSLFGNEQDLVYKDASTQKVVSYVRERLLSVFPAVSSAGVLRNGKGAPLFALLLGVSNPTKPAQKAALGIGNHLVNDLAE